MIITKYCIKIRTIISSLLLFAALLNLNARTGNTVNELTPKNETPQYAILSSAQVIPVFNLKTDKKCISDLEILFSGIKNSDEIAIIRLKSFTAFVCRKLNAEQKLYPFLSVYFATGT